MKRINFSLFKKIILLCGLLFILNFILNNVTKKRCNVIEPIVVEYSTNTNITDLSKKVEKQKEQSCSNCKQTADNENVNSNCAETCN